jgi:hypothetical protein
MALNPFGITPAHVCESRRGKIRCFCPERGFEPLAGGKRSATTGLLRPRQLHPGGMTSTPRCDPIGIVSPDGHPDRWHRPDA